MKTTARNKCSFLGRLVLALGCWLSALLVANNVHAAFGDLVAQYNLPASAFAMSPTQPYMYATIPSQNSIAIINTNTLALETTVFVGSGPTNLAFSPDGSRAYIANSTSNFVAVFNTQTRTVINSLLLPEEPQDVVFGTQNRLWVLGQNQIFQIDATTGASTGPSISNPPYIYGGSLEISSDRNTLYYADYGLCGASMYKMDVSSTNPILVLQSFGEAGCNGQDLSLSHNGNFICFATGAGQNLYDIAKFRTSDFASLGSFNTGPYPRVVGFSPDDLVVYAVHTDGEINVFDANTFLPSGTIFASSQAAELTVDRTGRYLFAGYTDPFFDFTGTRVFDTGRVAQANSAYDFNGDGKPDYVLYNATTRQTAIWYLNNNVYLSGAYGSTLPAGWMLIDTADFNGDGHPDYALYNSSTKQTAIWYLNNNVYISGAYGPTLPSGWELVATGDFNSDRKPDYVLYNSSMRQTAIWYMNNNAYVSGGYGPTLPVGWSVVGLGDFNGDGQTDYLLFNSTSRQSAIWYLSGRSLLAGAYGPMIASGYQLKGSADFNEDNKPDFVLSNQTTRQSAIWYMNNNTYVNGAYGPTPPVGWRLVAP
jgi:YVTN family beta-propeller protein